MLTLRIAKQRQRRLAAIQTISCILLLFVFIVSPACAQTLGLPSLDGITAFYRAGRLSAGPWQTTPTSPCAHGWSRTPLCGWGFETTYVLLDKEKTGKEKTAEIPKWGAELAVGYDFLNLRATGGATHNYDIRGSLQTLPSITLYVSWDPSSRVSLYTGIGTGLVVLKNLRAYDLGGHVYALSGDTWGFTPSIGLLRHLKEASESAPGANVFVEISYEVRDFPSVTYVLPSTVTALPSDLPRSLAEHGPVLNFGFEFTLKKKPEKPACCK